MSVPLLPRADHRSHVRFRAAPFTAILSIIALASCGGESSPARQWAGTTDTLASGAVRVRSPAEGYWTDEDRWRLVEDLRIGSLDGDGPDTFGAVGDLTMDALGRIYVVEAQSAEVRVFDRDGRHLRTLGGRGSGPGELQTPTALLWGPQGHLWVHDPRNRRYEVFDTTGARVGSRPFEGLPFGFAGAAFAADGLLYEMVPASFSGEGMRLVLASFRFDGDTRIALDTFPTPPLPSVETFEVSMESDGRTFTMNMPIPFQNGPSRQIHPGGFYWSNHGGDAYRLIQEGFGGDTLRIVERAYEPVAVTEAEVDDALEGFPGGRPSGLDRGAIPRARPPLESFAWAPDGSLWVIRYHAPGERAWDVFDGEGRYAGEAATALDLERFTPRHFGRDAILGVLRDELDVPYVVRLRIER